MDINFPPSILARKTFIVTTLMAVGFVAASYGLVISKDLDAEQPDRVAEGAEKHQAHGASATEGAHDDLALPEGHSDHGAPGVHPGAEDHTGHDHGSHQEMHHD
jgi:hypothetical protein